MTTTKTTRSLRIVKRLEYGLVVELTTVYKTAEYYVGKLGNVIRWGELMADGWYHVTENGTKCDCPAGIHGKPCKHADATRKLIQLGKIK